MCARLWCRAAAPSTRQRNGRAQLNANFQHSACVAVRSVAKLEVRMWVAMPLDDCSASKTAVALEAVVAA